MLHSLTLPLPLAAGPSLPPCPSLGSSCHSASSIPHTLLHFSMYIVSQITCTYTHTEVLTTRCIALSADVLCKKSQFIFLYMRCAFLHKAYLLTAQCSGTGATQPAIETTMSARSPRSRIALWMVCVSCTFLTQAPLFTHSLSNAAYIVPPQPHQPAAIRLALGVASSQCIKPARRLITAQRRWCCTQGAKVDP